MKRLLFLILFLPLLSIGQCVKIDSVYSTADKESLHVKFADEAVCIGPPLSKDSYLNIPNIMFDYDNNRTLSGLSFFNNIAESCGWIYRENITWIKMKDEEGEIFAGTDRMSMAVQPEAIKFLASLPKESIILFEGDRLFTSSFLEHCLENYDLQIFHLKTNESVREERYKLRGSNQDKTWLQGRESKINNIVTNMVLMFNIKSVDNNTYEEQNNVYNEIVETINGK